MTKAGPPPGRNTKQRVRTAKRRTTGSTRWLARQLNDPYVAAAKAEGYRSRAAYKLIELDARFGLLKPGMRVLDLGAAPGGWTQVAVARAGAGNVVALDQDPIDPIAGATMIRGDLFEPETETALTRSLGGPADIVLSDMAGHATGHGATDSLRVMALCEAAADLAKAILSPGGSFLCKLIRGADERPFVDDLRRAFAAVRRVKPAASRADSAEIYVLATGFRGDAADRA